MIPVRAQVPAVPITPKEIGLDVGRCYDAGAAMVHLHAREDDESPTWRGERFEEIITEVLLRAPEIIVCVTSSGRNWSDLPRRTEALSIPDPHKPELASLTLGSMNFPKSASVNAPDTIIGLIDAMQAANIVPELEVFDVGMANYARSLAKAGRLKPPYYFNILLGSLGTADFNATNIAAIVGSLPEGSTWALAGIGRYQLSANVTSLTLGGHVRVGLEDNPYFDWRTREPATNPRLVERLVRLGRELGREPVTPRIAREIIGIRQKEEVISAC
ncbi:hypothetical protein AWL63_18840 [Sphingomonas panacis]|uniref:3-keto-5-aminohexanoate cleavage protein n=2 Tax=Sphingomonas panacis TaxID=1560345 RepID=A0A1B3ZE38_9SPHN|nr:hypothetical protein AWL63_18840 [Sphingomonas panacis]